MVLCLLIIKKNNFFIIKTGIVDPNCNSNFIVTANSDNSKSYFTVTEKLLIIIKAVAL